MAEPGWPHTRGRAHVHSSRGKPAQSLCSSRDGGAEQKVPGWPDERELRAAPGGSVPASGATRGRWAEQSGQQLPKVPTPSPGLAASFQGEREARGPSPTLNQICKARCILRVAPAHAALGTCQPLGRCSPGELPRTRRLFQHINRAERGERAQTLLQKASDFLTEPRRLLLLLTAPGKARASEAGGVWAAGWVGEGRRPRCVLGGGGAVRSQDGQLATPLLPRH